MDSSDTTNGSRSALRQPFIDTANALASLYKQAVSAEREARDAGSRAAYMRIMEWAARKSRDAERVTPAEIMNFCSAELANIPPQTLVPAPAAVDRPMLSQSTAAPGLHAHQQLVPVAVLPHRAHHPQGLHGLDGAGDGEGEGNATQQQQVQTVAYDPLVSDIRKLHVNPRKRQRVDISDTFVRACKGADNDSLIFTEDGYAIRSDTSANPLFFETGSAVLEPSSVPARRDSRDSRDAPLISANPNDYPARKGKNAKAQMYDKLRRK